VSWRPHPLPWLFAEIAVTPGLYTDFKEFGSESSMLRGRGLAIFAFCREWQVVAGLLYVNRIQTKLLPAGGVIWNPNEYTRCQLLFPQPKISHCFASVGQTQWWGYLQGDFGGGRWAVQDSAGAAESIDYTDLRISLGMEWIATQGLRGHIEAGYVFDRKIRSTSAIVDFVPGDTLMLRLGVSY
jgi:hypothetical protein